MNKFWFFAIIFSLGCSQSPKNSSDLRVLSFSSLKWEQLNPARGKKSPQAATLWGNRKGTKPTGFLVKFVNGFSSPPHIHNVSYRAIVIDGLIHNDDPKAANMWMPKGSYWTQPAGEAHITSAKGKSNVAFVEIDQGPYLVRPTKKAFDNNERPYNIHTSNVLWDKLGPIEFTSLWKNKEGHVTGKLIKFRNRLSLSVARAKILVVKGLLKINNVTLDPGSLIVSENSTKIDTTCDSNIPCIVYLKSKQGFKLR